MQAKAAKYVIDDKIDKFKSGLSGGKKIEVNWNDFNWPPICKVIHFSLIELDEKADVKRIARLLWISHIIIFVISIINIINAIAQASLIEGEGMRVFYSFLFLMVFNPIHCYWFYCGYKGTVDEESLIMRFNIFGGLLFALYFFFSITSAANWNGWVRTDDLLKMDQGFCAALSIIESILFVLEFLFIPFALWQVRKIQNE